MAWKHAERQADAAVYSTCFPELRLPAFGKQGERRFFTVFGLKEVSYINVFCRTESLCGNYCNLG